MRFSILDALYLRALSLSLSLSANRMLLSERFASQFFVAQTACVHLSLKIEPSIPERVLTAFLTLPVERYPVRYPNDAICSNGAAIAVSHTDKSTLSMRRSFAIRSLLLNRTGRRTKKSS